MANRTFTREFKVSAVQLVEQQGYTLPQAAKSLGVDRTTLRAWIRKFGGQAGALRSTPADEAAIKVENRRLREENRRLLMEREILKKATAYFAGLER